ncbi:MAG: ferrous iron transport protein B [Gammaproteobacteria bacterium]|nr:ferrous iron transport protein B [Gammaproteobacteria bacterium]
MSAQDSSPELPIVVTLGNPNTGKSTLFNRLTGLRQKVGNYPGVTVEQVSGQTEIGGRQVRLVDVPGTYSLAAMSPDEMIAVDVLRGGITDMPAPAAALIVVDATNLRRNLFLASQILEAGVPALIALNMVDRLTAEGVHLDIELLSKRLGVPLVPISAANGTGIDELKAALDAVLRAPAAPHLVLNQSLEDAVARLSTQLAERGVAASAIELRRALIDAGGYAEQRLGQRVGPELEAMLAELRLSVGGGRNLATLEARDRYSWIQAQLKGVEERGPSQRHAAVDTADKVVNHPVLGTLFFALVMAMVFQAVFAWAAPLVDAIDYLTSALGATVGSHLPPGLLNRFITEGVIAGVGSVVVFLPQIIILFTFIIILEDTGYMARAAFLMDRAMRALGLSGQSFIPMLSSFACAVPGIMGTRVIANRHDRLATIMAAPFMTCSARLPVYSLLIAAFVPERHFLGGFINLQGLVLFALYMLGIVGGALTAWLISRLYWSRAKARFLLEMPPYRMPNPRAVLSKLLSRAVTFLQRAGTIIFSVALVVWVLASFPRDDAAPAGMSDADFAAQQLSDSYLGRMSRSVTPLFEPLGWDWKVTAAVIASFPAREVVIAALGTIYAVDGTTEDNANSTLTSRIRAARHADGAPVYTLPMVLGLLIFYALCLQCVSTIAVMRRETGTWRWPLFAWVYMSSLGYLGAWLAVVVGGRMGLG